MCPVCSVRDLPGLYLFPIPHPGVSVLLKTNAKPQFDKAVIRQLRCTLGVRQELNDTDVIA
jgi:hypothetical protein